ncbi:MAG: presenilin family intramembrane aspartyl protease [Candidatus Woesearchaeota archaeon]
MKHSLKISFMLLFLFLLAQVKGLAFLSHSIDFGEEIVFRDISLGERPEISGFLTLIYLVLGITIGTLIVLYLAKKNKVLFWKYWFFLAALIATSITLSTIWDSYIAWLLALIITSLRFLYPIGFTQNLSELLIYAGLAIFLVPMLNLLTISLLLVVISLYDAFAVWKSGHMIKMAKFTSKSNHFPGISLNYYSPKKKNRSIKNKVSGQNKKTGVLGGGDVVFPLLFSGTLYVSLLSTSSFAFALALIPSLFASLALLYLLFFSEKDKFYPAMPYISSGLFFGYLVVLMLI